MIDYLQSDGTGHLLGVYTVRVTCVSELTSQHFGVARKPFHTNLIYYNNKRGALPINK